MCEVGELPCCSGYDAIVRKDAAMVAIRQDRKSWEQGRAAGLQGKRNKCPSDIDDEVAWYSGYEEGKAEREALRPHHDRGPMR
jgi:hypothetical protein